MNIEIGLVTGNTSNGVLLLTSNKEQKKKSNTSNLIEIAFQMSFIAKAEKRPQIPIVMIEIELDVQKSMHKQFVL